jgi:hypothetical protein
VFFWVVAIIGNEGSSHAVAEDAGDSIARRSVGLIGDAQAPDFEIVKDFTTAGMGTDWAGVALAGVGEIFHPSPPVPFQEWQWQEKLKKIRKEDRKICSSLFSR